MKPRQYQTKLIQDAREKIREVSARLSSQGIKRKPRIVLRSACGSGKCLGYDTPVLMFDGTIKPVQDIVVGDLLMSPDGTSRTVLSLARGRENMYKIIPMKGDPYVVNESHILSLKIQPSKVKNGVTVKNISVRDVLSMPKNFLRTHRGWRSPANFGCDDIGIDPYFVGHWIGDGHSSAPVITTQFDEIKNYLRELANRYGITPKLKYNSPNSELVCLTVDRFKKNPISSKLRSLGVMPNKCIPMSIKRMSKKDRLSFLAGYLDADGYHDGLGGFEYSSKSEDIADGVAFIARSLGFACYYKKVRKRCGNNGKWRWYYRGYISGHTDAIPCKIEKNKAPKRRINKDVLSVGIRIEPIGEGDYYGFEIDGDNLFMLGDFTVTHNTFMSALMAKSCVERGGTVAFLAHRDFLVTQTSQTFDVLEIMHSYLAAGRWFNPWVPAHIGMIQSMKSRMNKIKPPTLCFIDEASHVVAKTWRSVIEAWPETTFILLTATPSFRTDGKGLEELADDMVHGPTEAELIKQGALSDFTWFRADAPDLSGMKLGRSDNLNAQADEFSKAVIVGNIVETYKKKAMGTRAIYFAPNIETSKKYAAAFTAAGIPAVHIDADSTEHERTMAARGMANGSIKIMTNVGIASYGYDLGAMAGADVTIETVGLCRLTASFPLLVQMAMRAMRAKPYPGIILDHAGNYDKHGWLPDDEVEWSLKGEAKKEKKPTYQCQGCGALMPRETLVCKNCGTPYTPPARGEARPSEIKHVDGELRAIQRAEHEARKKAARMEQGQARTLEELIALGKKRGYKFPELWAGKIYTGRKRSRV